MGVVTLDSSLCARPLAGQPTVSAREVGKENQDRNAYLLREDEWLAPGQVRALPSEDFEG